MTKIIKPLSAAKLLVSFIRWDTAWQNLFNFLVVVSAKYWGSSKTYFIDAILVLFVFCRHKFTWAKLQGCQKFFFEMRWKVFFFFFSSHLAKFFASNVFIRFNSSQSLVRKDATLTGLIMDHLIQWGSFIWAIFVLSGQKCFSTYQVSTQEPPARIFFIFWFQY